MVRHLQKYLLVFVAVVMGALVFVPSVSAIDTSTLVDCSDAQIAKSTVCKQIVSQKSIWDIWKNIINAAIYIAAIIAVIMLILGGIRYAISNGDVKAIAFAKNTIMYAIIGLVIAFAAYATVNWVIGALNGPSQAAPINNPETCQNTPNGGVKICE